MCWRSWRPSDRILLAAVSRILPRPAWLSLLPRPETLLRWHRELVRRIEDDELARLRAAYGDEVYGRGRFEEARRVFDRVALSDEFVEFLTLPAYDLID